MYHIPITTISANSSFSTAKKPELCNAITWSLLIFYYTTVPYLVYVSINWYIIVPKMLNCGHKTSRKHLNPWPLSWVLPETLLFCGGYCDGLTFSFLRYKCHCKSIKPLSVIQCIQLLNRFYPDVRIRFQTDDASIQRADETTSQSN